MTFLAHIWPEMDLVLQIQKTNIGIRISILQIPCVPIFRQNGRLEFFGPNLPKYWILGSEFPKFKSRFGISTTKIPPVPIFCQDGQLSIFRPKFGKLPNYVRYYASNNVEGVAESWVEVDGAGCTV